MLRGQAAVVGLQCVPSGAGRADVGSPAVQTAPEPSFSREMKGLLC